MLLIGLDKELLSATLPKQEWDEKVEESFFTKKQKEGKVTNPSPRHFSEGKRIRIGGICPFGGLCQGK